LPCAIGTIAAATAAALPPDDPPGVRAVSHGLRATPNALSDVAQMHSSGTRVMPTTIAPAARSRRTTSWSWGQGEEGWYPVENGDELLMVLGGQGLLMFPMPLRGKGFTLADDPSDYTHPDTPIFDMHLDIEGFDLDFGGHFKRLSNYPVPFKILPDGTYEFVYITLFVPDELTDPCDIDGLPGQLHAELDVVDGYVLTWDRSVIMSVPSSLCES
jgi:hypothetical protein